MTNNMISSLLCLATLFGSFVWAAILLYPTFRKLKGKQNDHHLRV